MKSKTSKSEMHSVALNHGLPDMTVQDIMESAFKMVYHTVENADRRTSDFKNIQLLNFGKFYVSPGKLNFYKQINDKNYDNQSNHEGNHSKEQTDDSATEGDA